MKQFISCDWGTSSFRLRLISADNQLVLAEIQTNEGMADVYQAWKQHANQDRVGFYRSVLVKHIKALQEQCGFTLKQTVMIISGMASSSIGMIELPYKKAPFKADGSDLVVHLEAPTRELACKMMIVSGVRTENDVMRGEETKLAGCDINTNEDDTLVILPGTHSKHVKIKSGIITGFKTYMTGEFFQLLSGFSILSASVKKNTSAADDPDFINGVLTGAKDNLLHSAFRVRTNQLLRNLDKEKNYHYLSGLLIGTELSYLQKEKFDCLNLVCGSNLMRQYMQALKTLSIEKNIISTDADAALIKGQYGIYEKAFS